MASLYIFLPFLFALQEVNSQIPQDPVMILITGGSFEMGQADGEGDERPVHRVYLDEFYLGKYEVTVSEYRLFCDQTNREMPKEPAWGWIDNHPIVNTTWHDATAYIDWINTRSGENYRLPTEAEFEYVLRNGGKPGLYPWGKNIPKNENIADESWKGERNPNRYWQDYNDGFKYTSPVGSFPPNEVGVCDINGNVWEWCMDWYSEYDKSTQTNPKGPESGTHKVGRGASFNADPWHCRTAGRSWVKPEFTGPGFRLAKDVLK